MVKPTTAEACGTCGKSKSLCVCEWIQPQKNERHVLILQHPQEPDKDLGSAKLATLILSKSTLKTSLSVASLKVALGKDESPQGWLVLYLGSKSKFEEVRGVNKKSPLVVFDKKDQLSDWDPASVRGIVILDGTWSQAKTLWWRNPWLLKCRRAVVLPDKPSMYGKLRKEPRRECLSTIEVIAETLDALGEDPVIGESLRSTFRRLLQKARDSQTV